MRHSKKVSLLFAVTALHIKHELKCLRCPCSSTLNCSYNRIQSNSNSAGIHKYLSPFDRSPTPLVSSVIIMNVKSHPKVRDKGRQCHRRMATCYLKKTAQGGIKKTDQQKSLIMVMIFTFLVFIKLKTNQNCKDGHTMFVNTIARLRYDPVYSIIHLKMQH